jgi:hypothetical protein
LHAKNHGHECSLSGYFYTDLPSTLEPKEGVSLTVAPVVHPLNLV